MNMKEGDQEIFDLIKSINKKRNIFSLYGERNFWYLE